ncbi:MAG: YggS family pyridoxal phosphate-dependent enzyme [Anaerolineales bacterium]|nr:YggS family pyridoxal phosphate-dependent enzyme [Anaerolineales bacterium]
MPAAAPSDIIKEMDELANRYHTVLAKIEAAAGNANRQPDEITLVAVTKTWPVKTILAAYAVGMRHFGENRAEELAEKRPAVEAVLGPNSGIVWHFIGTLQSRKAKLVADYADVFHALDRVKIAKRLSSRLQENGRSLPTFIEVNVSGEASKSGLTLINWKEDATQPAELRKVGATVHDLPGLSLQGLMTMAPWHSPMAEIQAVFAHTRQIANWLERELDWKRPFSLSMGMTDDYELAIAAGATHVRVGRALFGERHTI